MTKHVHFCDCDDCLNVGGGVRLEQIKRTRGTYVWRPASGPELRLARLKGEAYRRKRGMRKQPFKVPRVDSPQ